MTNHEINAIARKVESELNRLIAADESGELANFSVSVQETQKIQRPVTHSIIVKTADTPTGIAPVFYVEDFISEEKTPSEIATYILDQVQNNPSISQSMSTNVNNLLDVLSSYEQAKPFLVGELVNYDYNSIALSQCPFIKKHDLALIARVKIPEMSTDCTATTVVTNTLLHKWGVDADRVMTDTLANDKSNGFKCNGMLETLAASLGVSADQAKAMLGVSEDVKDEQVVISTDNNMWGAKAMFDTDILDKACDKLGSAKVFILPSSIHELIAVPDNGSIPVEDLESMVREINATQVAPDEKLSDNVYYYNSLTKELTMANDMALNLEKGEAR